jgi:hypothetical protein
MRSATFSGPASVLRQSCGLLVLATSRKSTNTCGRTRGGFDAAHPTEGGGSPARDPALDQTEALSTLAEGCHTATVTSKRSQSPIRLPVEGDYPNFAARCGYGLPHVCEPPSCCGASVLLGSDPLFGGLNGTCSTGGAAPLGRYTRYEGALRIPGPQLSDADCIGSLLWDAEPTDRNAAPSGGLRQLPLRLRQPVTRSSSPGAWRRPPLAARGPRPRGRSVGRASQGPR